MTACFAVSVIFPTSNSADFRSLTSAVAVVVVIPLVSVIVTKSGISAKNFVCSAVSISCAVWHTIAVLVINIFIAVIIIIAV